MRTIPKLLLKTQRESMKNRLEFNISLALDDAVKKLYADAENHINQKLKYRSSATEIDRRDLLIGELRIALTQLLAKSDLLDPARYEALSQSVQRWCPWEVENVKSGQLVRQLLILLLPQARKKQQLNQICSEYKTHLTTEIEGELRSEHPAAFAQYVKPSPHVFGGPKISPDTHVEVRIDSPQPLDQFMTEQAPRLKNPGSRFTTAIANYQAVRQMEDSLNKPIKPVTTQLQDFNRQFKAHRPVIEKNPDSETIQFIKRILNTLSKGLIQRLGFWRLKGQEVSQQIEHTLTPPATPTPLKGG